MRRSSAENRKRNLQLFHRKSKFLLSDIERDYLHDVLKQYEAYKDVQKLMLHLLDILDTPAKLDLLVEIRGLIPKMHLGQFDWLAPYAKMAHPVILTSDHHSTGTSGSGSVKHLRKSRIKGTTGTNGYHDNPGTALRMVTIDKDTDTLGFSIRGGSENSQGIFISSVEPGSLEDLAVTIYVESAGLGVGDKILEVNNISFDNITLSSAEMVLQGNSRLRLKVQHFSSMVGHCMAKEKTTWFDTVRRKMVDGDFNDVDPSHAAMGGTRLLSGGDERRVIITLSSQRCIGFNIRGGMEYGVGIYVSKVDKGGLAEAHGITVGDQIIDVNGVTTESVTHAQAVELIRNQPCLIMTIRSVNRYPAYKELYDDYPWMDRGTTPKRRHSASPTSGTTPLTRNELIDAIPVEVAEQYTQTHAHKESSEWPKNQSITMSPTPIPKSSRSSVATETSSLLQKHVQLPSNNLNTPAEHQQPEEQMNSPPQADAPMTRERTSSMLGRSHSMKFPGEKALPVLEPEPPANESRRLQRNRTFREILFGMKMKSKEKKEQKNKKPAADQKRLKKRYPSVAAYSSSNKKPSIEHPHQSENTDQSGPSAVSWATRKPVEGETSTNPIQGSVVQRRSPNPPSLLQTATAEQQLGTNAETLQKKQQLGAFTHGAGTQLMYSDTRYASAMSVLEVMAKKLLNQDECDAIMRLVKVYHQEGRIENLVTPLLVILDKPEKILLLREVRGVIAPSDLGRFDSMVTRKELQAYDQLQFGRKDPSQPMHSLRRNSIDKPRRTILEPKQDQEGKFVLQTREDVKQNKRRQQELEDLRRENQRKVSALKMDDPTSDTSSLLNSDIAMSLFDNPGKNSFKEDEPRSGSAESSQSREILNALPEEPPNATDTESEVIFAGLHKESSLDSKIGKTDMADSKSDSASAKQYTENEIRIRKQWLDPDYIPNVDISQHQADENGQKWVLPRIEDESVEDVLSFLSRAHDTETHRRESSSDDSDDVALPKFEDDSSDSDAGSNLENVSVKPNKSGLYSLIHTNHSSCQEGGSSNSTSPTWSSPNAFSPVSDMSLPPTPVSQVDTPVSPSIPKTPPNTQLHVSPNTPQSTTSTPENSLVKDEPIYAKVDMSKKRSRQALNTSLSVDESVDGSLDSSDSGRRSPYKVTFTDYRSSKAPSRKGILKNSFSRDEAPQIEKRRFSSDYMDIDDINLGEDPAPLQEIDAEARMCKASSSASSADEEALEQLQARMETMTVTLSKSRTSLGISVSGGRDSKDQPEVRIDRIFAGGAASDDGILQAGCEVVSVDGKSLQGVTHPQAVDIIRKAYHDKTKKTIEFVVKQPPNLDTHL